MSILGKRTGKKNLTIKNKEEIKNLIRQYELLRLRDHEIIENLEDEGFNIGNTTLYKLKKELRDELGNKLERLGRHELMYEHFLSIQMLQDLERNLLQIMNDPNTSTSDKVRVSTELRSLIKDIFDFYGSSDVVESVFKYFQENYPVS